MLRENRFRLIVQGVGSQDPGDPDSTRLRSQPTIAELARGSFQAHILGHRVFLHREVRCKPGSSLRDPAAQRCQKDYEQKLSSASLSAYAQAMIHVCDHQRALGSRTPGGPGPKRAEEPRYRGLPETAARQPSSKMCLRARASRRRPTTSRSFCSSTSARFIRRPRPLAADPVAGRCRRNASDSRRPGLHALRRSVAARCHRAYGCRFR